MTHHYLLKYLILILIISARTSYAQKKTEFQLLIVGGGASGTMAGVQAARMGVKTLIVERTEWLGGMLTSAGVSAIDGNHQLPSGLWGEFRQKLYDHYGGAEKVSTGWVSNTLFEPSVGNKILKEMAAAEANLTVWYNAEWVKAEPQEEKWNVLVRWKGKEHHLKSVLVIDATELGDVMATLGAGYSIGMDSKYSSGEQYAPEKENNIIQDMTYVVTLKDYGKGADKTIKKPLGYDPSVFACACNVADPISFDNEKNDCHKMMTYGKLPNNKYMINWPHCGNDIYLNFIEASEEERNRQIEEAKLHSLRFIYYLQTELGLKHLGLAKKEYPSKDHLPFIPYYRESRRLKGIATLTLNHLTDPYDQPQAYYRTGIAVGDYPIDHHHLKNPEAPEIDFVKIRVPSYNIPLGSLIPQEVKGLIVAEKSISVSNIVNGTTRLQPVVLEIGQAAGALAAISLKNKRPPRAVSVREVQAALLEANAYLMPYIDVRPGDPHFQVLQRIGATGILKGKGVAYKWANQMWFYPELPVSEFELLSGLREYYPELKNDWSATGELLHLPGFVKIVQKIRPSLNLELLKKDWQHWGFESPWDENILLSRRIIAVLLDHYLDPFSIKINMAGHIE
ncbi:FAD-dependent oxidoreductase [Rapidithrix thailandica]|uniref:FAD-dependent oxidoreductase n=1 Tax=Rapidithrix thailandica TaxID=413964 RepID=A0AAW9S7H9_9BACT